MRGSKDLLLAAARFVFTSFQRGSSVTLNSVFLYKIRGLSRSQPILIINQLQAKQLADIKIPYRELFAAFIAKYTYLANYLLIKQEQTSK